MGKRTSSGSGSGSSGQNVWVGPHDGKWQVKREGNDRASRVTDTQREAIAIGRKYAEQEGSDLIIQGTNGQIRDRDSHGNESATPDKDGHSGKKS